MTFGMMKKITKPYKFILIIVALFITLPAFALDVNNSGGVNLDLAKLLNMFSQQKQSQVDFEEEKHAFYLETPIRSSGYLKYSAPNKLNKIILKPEKVTQEVVGDTLTINDGNETHIVDLTEHPEFSIILRSLISVLSGDQQALKKDFKVSFENQTNGWTLSLRPHDSFVSSYVELIQMFGNKNIFTKMIVKEPNNDYSVTLLSNHR